MRFFIDEDLSPSLTSECHAAGYDATCSRNRDILGATDHEVAVFCLGEERVLVTNNVGDFFRLAKAAGLHPGLVFMPLGTRGRQREWVQLAIEDIERHAELAGIAASDLMINNVLEVAEDGSCRSFEYP